MKKIFFLSALVIAVLIPAPAFSMQGSGQDMGSQQSPGMSQQQQTGVQPGAAQPATGSDMGTSSGNSGMSTPSGSARPGADMGTQKQQDMGTEQQKDMGTSGSDTSTDMEKSRQMDRTRTPGSGDMGKEAPSGDMGSSPDSGGKSSGTGTSGEMGGPASSGAGSSGGK